MQAFASVSTWRQPMPPPASPGRTALIARGGGPDRGTRPGPAETALRRGIARDRAAEGEAEAARVHCGRYHVAEAIYLAEVRPQAKADVIIDNHDFARPAIVGPAAGR